MSGENVVGVVVLVGLPALAIAVRMVTKRFLDAGPPEGERDREKVSAPD